MKRAAVIFLSTMICLPLQGADFPEPFNSEPDKSAAPPSAEEALGMWSLPEGFNVELFASEPEVQNPVAMAWDRRGRMWVAENYTYAEREVRFELTLNDRVVILADSDGDGRSDQRKVFLDDVQRLTSVELGRGGVWLMCPPQLLFVPDRNEDDIPDGELEVVLDGFTVAESSYHNFANGLRWGPDGWLYGRTGHSCPGQVGAPGTAVEDRIPTKGGIWRYHPERKVFEALNHGTTNPWGHDWDKHGQLFFINTVNGHLWHGIHGAHFTESFGADPNPLVYSRIDTHADHYHYDRGGKWSESRDGAANEFGGGHAHVGMMIYQGKAWPERFHDRLFTLNMHGRRTNVERLDREGSGYVGRHEPDVFLMGDEWFRGIDIQPGPDGAVYLLDWSDTGECHDHTGVHRTSGRIYRIQYGEGTKPNLEGLDVFSSETLKGIYGDDPWYHRQVWARFSDADIFEDDRTTLVSIFMSSVEPVEVRLRALRMFAANGGAIHEWKDLLADPAEQIRAACISLLVDEQPIDTIVGPRKAAMPEPMPWEIFKSFVSLAENDSSGLVRLTLASALQRLPYTQRAGLGAALAGRAEDSDDHNLPEMVWYGISPLVNSDPAALVSVAEATQWPDLLRWIARSLSERIEKDGDSLDALLRGALSMESSKQLSILEGVSDGLQGWRKATPPESWSALAKLTSKGDKRLATLTRELNVIFGDGRALDEIKGVALDKEAELATRKAALLTLIENKPDDLREICESLLDERILNAVAVKGLVLFDDPELGKSLAKRYGRFSPADRSSVIETLIARPAWALALLEEIGSGKIERRELSAFQARQILAFDDEKLSRRLTSVWGNVRASGEAKEALIKEWTKKLPAETLAQADLSQGRLLFSGICGACHVMYGQGGKIGPDLTGSNRSDLGYLLVNIFDPGSEVSPDYRMSIVTMKDGRVLTGVVAEENDRTLSLRQASELMTLSKSDIAKSEVSDVSMMPDGLIQAFTDEQVRDLIGYLMNPTQVSLP
ncbi:MAG: c-type cytochrome [Verrucomicrobiales bacterium]|nr:c-type cytochrome [Verrucomicrobiales bacterium]